MLKILILVFLVLFLRTFFISPNSFSTVNLVIGLPGSGKTTSLAAITHIFTHSRASKKSGLRVFSNVPVKDAIPYSWNEFGKYDMSRSVVCLDEAGLCVDNRAFKTNFTPERLEYLKLLRHRHDILICFSQTSDVDLKIRAMAGQVWICTRSRIPGVTVLSPVNRKIGVDEDQHQLMDMYYLRHPFLQFFAAKRIFRPFYYGYFDSYEAPELPNLPDRDPYSVPARRFSLASKLKKFFKH